jgi:superfamily II DNA or RNA helicase
MIKQERQQKTESEFCFRPGQRKALDTIVDFLKSPKESSYILATGSFGKTVLYVKGVEEYRALNPDKSGVLVLADSVNLLKQLEREFKLLAPNLTAARASRENPSPKADITFASIQRCRTLLNEQKLGELLRPLVIVDEAHSLLGEETQKLVAYMIKQGCHVLGGTATDEYYADKKLSTVLGPPCYTLTYQEALELKVVAPFKTGAISLPFNMSHVHKIGGDYDRAALAALFPAEACAKAIATYHQLYHQGNKGYVQCLSRAHAKSTASYLTKAGIPSAAVTGDLPEAEREEIIQQAKNGKLHLLCGRNLLVQGIDWPEASVAYNFPSASKLAVEQRGFRVTRLDPANPNKCANIVEILPTTIAKARPPLMFREVVDGGIHLKGGRTSRPEKSLRSKASPTEFELFPDERDAAAIINEVLQGSGPWARLSRNMPTPEKLNEMTRALLDSTSAFLNSLSEHDQFPNLLEALALKTMRERRESDSVPKLDPKVEHAIEELLITGNLSDEPRAEALREIQRFLFGPAKYRSETDTVCALGLSPARVSELLPECLQLNEADLLAGLLTIEESLSLLNLMGESASALAAVFEPLIECQAALRRLNRTGSSADSDWYFRGAKTLMESILLHDGSTTKRFQSYLNSLVSRLLQNNFNWLAEQLLSSGSSTSRNS